MSSASGYFLLLRSPFYPSISQFSHFDRLEISPAEALQ
jgi:hypothetical protein